MYCDCYREKLISQKSLVPNHAALGLGDNAGWPASKKAFTLIELLVVIAIISLLISILLPSLKQAKELARQAACMANMKSLGVASHIYAGDNAGILPPNMGAGHWTGCQLYAYHSGSPRVYNHGVLYQEQYVSGREIFVCPSARPNGGVFFDSETSFYGTGRKNYFWESDERYETLSSYYYWLREPFVTMGGELYTYKQASDFESPNTAIMSDVLYVKDWESHPLDDENDFLANVLAVSGSVTAWRDSQSDGAYSVPRELFGWTPDPEFQALWRSFDGF